MCVCVCVFGGGGGGERGGEGRGYPYENDGCLKPWGRVVNWLLGFVKR